MEDKIRIEEDTRKAIIRHRGDPDLAADETGRSIEYIFEIRRKLYNDMMKNPDSQLWIADNITRELLIGRKHRIQHLLDMLEKLDKRESMWVCVICDTEVQEMTEASNNLKFYHCPVCDKEVKAKILDKDRVFARKQSLLEDLRKEDAELRAWLVDMNWINNPKASQPQQPVGPSVHIKHNTYVLTGEADKKIINDYSKLNPMDTEVLIERIRKDISKLTDEIKREETGPSGDANSLRLPDSQK